MRGKFITFEGGEGTGKSTQISLLAERLEALGHKTVITREPGGTAGAEAIRHVLLSGAAEQFGTDTEAILFAAARADHVDQVILPELKAGKYVLCDRFFDSTRAYQGATGNVSYDTLHALEQAACKDAWPDLTLILNLSIEESIQRAKDRRGNDAADRFEREALDQQEARQQAFLDIANNAPERCVVVDASGSVEEVSAAIWQAVKKHLLMGGEIESQMNNANSKEKIQRLKHNGHK